MPTPVEITAHRQLCLSSMQQFVTKMFSFMNHTNYILGEHHVKIMEALDDVLRGNCNKLIINIAPRYGKTLLVSQMFIAYGMAINPLSKFIHLSYSGGLVTDNSIAVKDIMNSEYFQLLFDARIKKGSDTKAKWETEQGGGMYATTTLGQITGFGAGRIEREDSDIEELSNIDNFAADYNPDVFSGAIVIDDPIKPEDALSDVVRERVNRRFETTIRNRVNSRRTPIIVIMQRLHEHDLCGYLQEIEPDDWKVISFPCLTIGEDGEEKALWEFKHNVEELHKIQAANDFVFETQYQQNPTPLEGLMYRPFKTYAMLPKEGERKNYTDTADTGSDYLCSICYVEYKGFCYVTDILFSKKPMEYTEPALADMLWRNETRICRIEGNNGGRGFARNVERISREQGNTFTQFTTFSQTQNKNVRIFTHSNSVNNVILLPEGWERLFPEYAMAMKGYRKEGRNAHDDAPDATTGVYEWMNNGVKDMGGYFF